MATGKVDSPCFSALGLDPNAATAEDVEKAYEERMRVIVTNTEIDKIARRLLGKNRRNCLLALGKVEEDALDQ